MYPPPLSNAKPFRKPVAVTLSSVMFCILRPVPATNEQATSGGSSPGTMSMLRRVRSLTLPMPSMNPTLAMPLSHAMVTPGGQLWATMLTYGAGASTSV